MRKRRKLLRRKRKRRNVMTIKQQQVEHPSFNNYSLRIPRILLLNHQNERLHHQRKGFSKFLFLFSFAYFIFSTTDEASRSSLTPPARSKSLTIDRRTPTIFKQKALSLPMTKPEKKKRQTKKDPMSIFDFDEEDDAAGNGTTTIGLRSSITTTTDQNNPIKKKVNRRSTTTIKNEIPPDALCAECSKPGSDQTMTDCDQCKHFYHFACCTPPLSSFPKRRNYGWSCHRCDEPSDDEHSSTKVNKRERKATNRASDQEIFNEN